MVLSEGDAAPAFEASDQNGKNVRSGDFAGKRFVLYFYPHDDTYFCTREACGFQESIEAFRELDVDVVGVSADSVRSHKAFADKHGIQFPLLADKPRTIIRAYGADGLLGRVTRVTYLIGPDGSIEGVYRSELTGRGHVDWARRRLGTPARPPA